MVGRLVVSLLALTAVACGAAPPPPPPPLLPPEGVARPLPGAGIPPNEPRGASVTSAALPASTGDRELDGLRVGFYGCRMMGLRIMPSMSGTAVLQARLGPAGEVLDVQPVTVRGLPHTVVACLVERVWVQRFDPRGRDGSILSIPVDFTRPAEKPAPQPTRAEAGPTRAL
jgi:hypothetical protein